MDRLSEGTSSNQYFTNILNKTPAYMDSINDKNNLHTEAEEDTTLRSDDDEFLNLELAGSETESYKDKLFRLVHTRALKHEKLDNFNIDTNLQGIGALDDICLRFTLDDQNFIVFLKTKYDKDKVTLKELWSSTGNYSILKYFQSYLNIRKRINFATVNNMFQAKYADMRSHFVIYTTAIDEITEKNEINEYSDKTIKELLSTGDKSRVFQYKYNDSDIKHLTKFALMESLGKKIFQFIHRNKYKNILLDELIRKYHIALAHKVINSSEIIDNNARNGSFREEFLISNDKYLVTLKETLFKESVKKTKLTDRKKLQIAYKTMVTPTVKNISKLLQSLSTCYSDLDNRLQILDMNVTLNDIPDTAYNEAYQMAIKEKLGKLNFKLPLAFGNVDLEVSVLDKNKRLNVIVKNIVKMLSKFENKCINLTNDSNLLPKLIGNLLILDEDNETFKFNMQSDDLGENAKYVLNKLKTEVRDLEAYRIKFKKITLFEVDKHEYDIAKDFLDKLWFYTQQAKNYEIDEYTIAALDKYYNSVNKIENNVSHLQSQIFLKENDEEQKFWLFNNQASHITKNMPMFHKILYEPIHMYRLNMLNNTYINEIQKFGIVFNENSLKSLDSLSGLTIVETGNKILTSIKLLQYFRNEGNCIFIDLNDTYRLSSKEIEDVLKELKKNNHMQTLIIIFNNLLNVTQLKDFITASNAKSIVIVIDKNLTASIEKNINKFCSKITDNKNNLVNLSLQSQTKILKEQLIFQGLETTFDTLIDEDSKHLITEDILVKIINKETVHVGNTLISKTYETIKSYYVPRRLHRSQKKLLHIKTFQDIKGTVVLLGSLGMGKSTYLTYLSMETKIKSTGLWIEYVNLIDYREIFHQWKEGNIKIDLLEALKCLCYVVIADHFTSQRKNQDYKFDFKIEVKDGNLVLDNINNLDRALIFDLEIFLNCYNKGNTVLLFDGFEKMFPSYEKQVTELLKCFASKTFIKVSDGKVKSLETKQQMWISSRPCKNIKKILKTEFGNTYTLKPFSDDEQALFIEKYFKFNFNLKNLSYNKLEIIDDLYKYMMEFNNLEILTHNSLLNMYCSATKYFQKEIEDPSIPSEKVMFRNHWKIISTMDQYLFLYRNNNWSKTSRSPLYMNILINYFGNIIRCKEKRVYDQWNLYTNTVSFYKTFLEAILSQEHFVENNLIDLQNPDNRVIYEKERIRHVMEHEELAFYVMLKNDSNKILDGENVKRIQNRIKSLETGEYESDLAEYVLQDVPTFSHYVHFTLTEYLAIEYMTNLLQNDSYEERMKIWKFILVNFLPKYSRSILKVFDHKVKYCSHIFRRITTNLKLDKFTCKPIADVKIDRRVVFDERNHNNQPCVGCRLDDCVKRGYKNITILLISIVTEQLVENVDEFFEFVNLRSFFVTSLYQGMYEIVEHVLNFMRNVDDEEGYNIYYFSKEGIPLAKHSNGEIINILNDIMKINDTREDGCIYFAKYYNDICGHE